MQPLPPRPARTTARTTLAPPHRTGRVLARLLSWIALSLSILVFAVAGIGYGAYSYYNSRLNHVSIRLGGDAGASTGPEQNFVLAGSDTRDFKGGAQFQGSGSDYVTGQRSDTVMLVHIPAGAAKVTVVSFPRDSYVTIPAFRDQQGTVHEAYPAKLNEAFAVGGPALLVKLIENLTGLHVDHYVQVDFAGFKDMVDALGGVTLCVRTTRADHDSGDYLTSGIHPNVDGATALAFVRDRKGLAQGDLDRIKDQQYFISQMMKRALSVGTLVNPLKVNAFLRATTADIKVDTDFGFGQLRLLATRLRHLDPGHVTFLTIPYAGLGNRIIHGYYQNVVLLATQRDAELFDAIRRGVDLGAPVRPAAYAPLDTVRTAVRNATGTAGLAARTATELQARGVTVTDVGSLAPSAITMLRYPPDQIAQARTLARLAGARPVLDPTLTHLELVLGGNFRGLSTTPGTSPAGPSPRPTPTSPTAGLAAAAAATTGAGANCAP